MATTRYGKVVGRKNPPKRRKTTRRRKNPTLALPARGGTSKGRKKTTKKRASSKKRPGYVWVKGHTRKGGVKVKGHWMKKGSKKRASSKRKTRKAGTRKYVYRRPGRYRVKRGPQKGKLKKYPRRTKKTASRRRKTTAKRRTTTKRRSSPKRYRVRKPGGRGYYLRRYPKKSGGRRKTTAKRKTTRRRSPRRYAVTVRRGKAKGTRYLRKYPKRYRSKGGKVWVKGYTRRDGVKVKGHWMKRPKRGSYIGGAAKRRGKKGRRRTTRRRTARRTSTRSRRWTTARGAIVANPGGGLMSYATNPGALSFLPTMEQFKSIGKAAGIVAVGVGGGVAAGKALAMVPSVRQYLGAWTPVAGSILGGLAFWGIASYLDNASLNEMKPYVAAGAGIAAILGIARNLVAGEIIPSRYASWVLPGAAGAAVSVATDVPEAAVGQIDVYEAALDGVGGIEDELEAELSRLGGMGDGEGIFGSYESVPLGADVEQAVAAYESTNLPTLGADVEQAVAAYESVPLGASVEEAVAAYESVPLGAEVEEAFADDTNMSAPALKTAVQNMVRRRVSQGQPLNNAFYNKLGKAAANVAQRKVEGNVRRTLGASGVNLPMDQRLPPVTRAGAPKRTAPVLPRPSMGPAGGMMPIPSQSGLYSAGGIFGPDSDPDGIF